MILAKLYVYIYKWGVKYLSVHSNELTKFWYRVKMQRNLKTELASLGFADERANGLFYQPLNPLITLFYITSTQYQRTETTILGKTFECKTTTGDLQFSSTLVSP